MRRIAYISSEWLIDTDITVIGELASEYELHFFYVCNCNSPRYNIEKLKSFCMDHNIHLHLYNHCAKYLSIKTFWLNYWLIKDADKLNPELIVKINSQLYWLILSSFFLRGEIVYGFHDVKPHSNTKGGFLINFVIKQTIRLNKTFFVYSSTQFNFFTQHWPNKNVVNVGMSAKSFGEPHVKCPPISGGVKLLFFGRIEAYKGLGDLISYMEKLQEDGIRNITLSIYGKGPYWSTCVALIRTKEIFNLNIRFIENEEIADLFSSHHFLILPYRDTTQSGPLLIAANYGIPIVAPRFPSFLEIYSENSALFYDKGNLLDALKRLSTFTDSDYSNLKSNAESLKNRLSEKIISKNYIDFFNNILNNDNY